MSFNYSEICDLIYEKKSEESLNKALSLLSEPAVGLEEALRYLYMRKFVLERKQIRFVWL